MDNKLKNLKLRIIRNIVIALLAVLILNFIVLYYLNFPLMAISQIKKYFPLLILLIIGFGAQIGLYTYLKHHKIICSITTTASGGISSFSMILCCSHYLINFLPFISISTASYLTKYTFQILLFGVIANLIGILIMIKEIKKVKYENNK